MTLIELLVSIAIFLVLASAVVVNLNSTSTPRLVSNAATALASDLRRAQNLAQTGATISGGAAPAGGYGIAMAEGGRRYILFGDSDNDHTYKPSEDLSSINLLPKVAFGKFNVPPFGNQTMMSVQFTPPNADVAADIDGQNPVAWTTVCIELIQDGDSGYRRYVEVLGVSGQINILESSCL